MDKTVDKQAMYDLKIQLALLDEIAKAQHRHNLDEIDLTDPDRKENHKYLVDNGYINTLREKVPDGDLHILKNCGYELTHKGKKLRFDLREKSRMDWYPFLTLVVGVAVLFLTLVLTVRTFL